MAQLLQHQEVIQFLAQSHQQVVVEAVLTMTLHIIQAETVVQAEVQNLPVLSVAEILHQFHQLKVMMEVKDIQVIMVQVAEAVQQQPVLQVLLNQVADLVVQVLQQIFQEVMFLMQVAVAETHNQDQKEQAAQVEAVTQTKVVVVQAQQTQVAEVQVHKVMAVQVLL
jgi:hypothetical protein